MKPRSRPERSFFALSVIAGVPCLLGSSVAYAQETKPVDPRGLAVDLHPVIGWVAAPQSLTTGLLGIDLGVRLSRHVTLSLDGAWYELSNRDPPFASRAAVNESRFSSDLAVVLYPLAARTQPEETAGTIEPYASCGLGLMIERPVAVVDVARRFNDDTDVVLTAGIGARMFVTRWFALSLDARDLAYFARRENPVVAHGVAPLAPTDPATWLDPQTHLVNDIQVRLGATFVLGQR